MSMEKSQGTFLILLLFFSVLCNQVQHNLYVELLLLQSSGFLKAVFLLGSFTNQKNIFLKLQNK